MSTGIPQPIRIAKGNREVFMESPKYVLCRWKGEFVTWMKCRNEDGEYFELGHYFTRHSENQCEEYVYEDAKEDFMKRVKEFE